MASVKAYEVYDTHRRWGQIYTQYQVTITDNDGQDYVEIDMPRNRTGQEVADKMLARLQRSEIKGYIAQIRAGNPVNFSERRFVDSVDLYRGVIFEAFKADIDDDLVFNVISYLNPLSDTQLRSLLDIDQAKVDRIRDKVTAIEAIATARTNYVPEDLDA